MKKRKLFACLFTTYCIAFYVQAGKSYEPFNYDIESDPCSVSDQDEVNGWEGAWFFNDNSSPTASIVEGYSYLGLDCGTAVQITNGNIGRMFYDALPDEAGKVYWMSILIKPSSENTARWAGFQLLNKTGDQLTGCMVGLTWGATNWGGYLDKETVSDVFADIENPTLIVTRVDMSGDESSEEVHFWVNPDVTASELNVEEATFEGTTNLSAGFNTIAVCCASGVNMTYDNVVVGSSWSEVNLYSEAGIPKTLTPALALECTPSVASTTATLRYHLSADQKVKISLYSLLGKEAAVLLNAEQTAGSQEVTFSTNGLCDGVYVCKLQAGTEVATTQIIIKK